MARLFIAVLPTEPVVAQLSAISRADRGIRWVRPDQWHVTLLFVADADPAAIDGLLEGQRFPAATAVYGPATATLGSAVIVPVQGLDSLAAAVHRTTAPVPGADRAAPFRGHLTLGRLRRRRAPPEVLGQLIDVRQEVAEIVLMESRPDGRGHVHFVRSAWAIGS